MGRITKMLQERIAEDGDHAGFWAARHESARVLLREGAAMVHAGVISKSDFKLFEKLAARDLVVPAMDMDEYIEARRDGRIERLMKDTDLRPEDAARAELVGRRIATIAVSTMANRGLLDKSEARNVLAEHVALAEDGDDDTVLEAARALAVDPDRHVELSAPEVPFMRVDTDEKISAADEAEFRSRHQYVDTPSSRRASEVAESERHPMPVDGEVSYERDGDG